jgi:hypothetical protein
MAAGHEKNWNAVESRIADGFSPLIQMAREIDYYR